MGGVLTDLASRLNRIENRYITYPNNNGLTNLVSLTGDVVPNWDKDNNPYETVTVPSNGWVNVKTKVRNYDSVSNANNGIFEPRLIEVFIGANRITRAIAGLAGLKCAVAACTDNMFPARAGEVIKYGSTGSTPNGAYTEVVITHFPFIS